MDLGVGFSCYRVETVVEAIGPLSVWTSIYFNDGECSQCIEENNPCPTPTPTPTPSPTCSCIQYSYIWADPPVGTCGEVISYTDCTTSSSASINPPGGTWSPGDSGIICSLTTPVYGGGGACATQVTITPLGCCGSTPPTPTPTPTKTATTTPTPTKTPTPTPSCTAPGVFLTGTLCYGSEWNVILRPSSLTACQAAQGVDGEAARNTNQWRSCCDYQSVFVEGNPSGCLVYDENGDLAGNGWISDGCLSWQVTNGVVTSTSAVICTGASVCCGSTPT